MAATIFWLASGAPPKSSAPTMAHVATCFSLAAPSASSVSAAIGAMAAKRAGSRLASAVQEDEDRAGVLARVVADGEVERVRHTDALGAGGELHRRLELQAVEAGLAWYGVGAKGLALGRAHLLIAATEPAKRVGR